MTRMFNPPHPGGLLAEGLEYLGFSARQFAKHIGVAPSTVTRILKEESPITPEMAVRISANDRIALRISNLTRNRLACSA